MNNKENLDNVVFFEWSAASRYFEKKPMVFFKLVISLALVLSLLAYFLGETILIFVIWATVFVVYIKTTVVPPQTKYKLTKFGIQILDTTVLYKTISAFTIVSKAKGDLLRFFNIGNSGEFYLMLPDNPQKKQKIISFLQKKIPYIEKVPKTEIEKIADFLKKLIGL